MKTDMKLTAKFIAENDEMVVLSRHNDIVADLNEQLNQLTQRAEAAEKEAREAKNNLITLNIMHDAAKKQIAIRNGALSAAALKLIDLGVLDALSLNKEDR